MSTSNDTNTVSDNTSNSLGQPSQTSGVGNRPSSQSSSVANNARSIHPDSPANMLRQPPSSTGISRD
nr:uncharacterized protein CI109_001671 [Kwoniella shandongensis]KAA5529732.1 hypothetical protein CI109_001671 [Kwoniella shandongensis]